MAGSVTAFPSEPVVITRITIPIHEHWRDIEIVNKRIAKLLNQVGYPLYRICDARHMNNLDYSDILLWIEEEIEHQAGSLYDPRVRVLMVGSSPMIELAVKKMRERGHTTISLFSTLDEALSYARDQIGQSPASAVC